MTGAPWHLGMLAAFDVETTGTSVESDRIVTACVAHIDGTGTGVPVVRDWLVDPGIEIPEDVAKIHGITTEKARAEGMPAVAAVADIADELLTAAGFPSATPVVAFNACFDLTLLDRETRRHGLDPFGEGLNAAKALIIDPFVIDKALDPYRKGKRTLTAVSAHGDAVTAARVAWVIAARNPRIARMSATELMAWQAKARREQARSLREFRRGRGEPYDDISEAWPWTPWTEEAAA